MTFATIKFVHLLSLLLLFCASAAKNLLLRGDAVNGVSIGRCRIADRVSGAAAGMIVVTGIALIYLSPKGSEHYTTNLSFWIKMTILVLASALIIKTKLYLKAKAKLPGQERIAVPAAITGILRFDFASLIAMTFLGVLVAYGIGMRL